MGNGRTGKLQGQCFLGKPIMAYKNHSKAGCPKQLRNAPKQSKCKPGPFGCGCCCVGCRLVARAVAGRTPARAVGKATQAQKCLTAALCGTTVPSLSQTTQMKSSRHSSLAGMGIVLFLSLSLIPHPEHCSNDNAAVFLALQITRSNYTFSSCCPFAWDPTLTNNPEWDVRLQVAYLYMKSIILQRKTKQYR